MAKERKKYYRPSIEPDLEVEMKTAAASLGMTERAYATQAIRRALDNPRQALSFEWVRVEDGLPPIGAAVLVRRNEDNWIAPHTLGGSHRDVWRWQACWRREAKVQGNNTVPYKWETFGPHTLFGQRVSHWMLIHPTDED